MVAATLLVALLSPARTALADPPPSASPPASAGVGQTAGWVLLGSGLLLGAGGGLLFYVGDAEADAARPRAERGGDGADDAVHRSTALYTTGAIVMGAGLVAAGVGLTLLVLAPKSKASPAAAVTASPGQLMLTGRF